jgi:hypothetical protein
LNIFKFLRELSQVSGSTGRGRFALGGGSGSIDNPGELVEPESVGAHEFDE